MVLGSVELAISEGRWLGSGAGISGVWGVFRDWFGSWKSGGGLLGFWVSLGKENGGDFAGLKGLVSQREGGERRCRILAEGRRRECWLSLSLDPLSRR